MKHDHGFRETEICRQKRIHIVREPSLENRDSPLEFLAASERLANARKREAKGRAENLSELLQHSLEVLSFYRTMSQNNSLLIFRPDACPNKRRAFLSLRLTQYRASVT